MAPANGGAGFEVWPNYRQHSKLTAVAIVAIDMNVAGVSKTRICARLGSVVGTCQPPSILAKIPDHLTINELVSCGQHGESSIDLDSPLLKL